ncbi:unnamed protein product [Urochloa decumbens]|uniref:DUF1618 domain-containing protein n=1 Tax=Urochloa decumbens TaxID=240449 RepID=A0ABC8XKN2_9POAL
MGEEASVRGQGAMGKGDHERKRTSRRRRRRRRRHFYLVFDDWSWGYSIRKVDLSSSSSSVPADRDICRRCRGRRDRRHRRGEQRLPPAVFHLEGPRGSPFFFTSAFGTKIVALHHRDAPVWPDTPFISPRLPPPLVPNPPSPVFDVRARALGSCRRHEGSVRFHPTYIPAGDDRLFALCHGPSFHLLHRTAPPDEPWRAVPAPPVGDYFFAASHAVHPDGRTVFVSFSLGTDATYSFHMPEEEEEEGFVGWKPRGKWKLPRPALLDRDLNAWVGISCAMDQGVYGHACALDVVPADPGDSGGDGRPPAWKLSKEKLVRKQRAKTHVGIGTLLYMGRKSRYCLVECFRAEDQDSSKDDDVVGESDEEDDTEESDDGDEEDQGTGAYRLRVTTFSLKLDENGDLTIGNSRRVRYFSVSEGTTAGFVRWNPVAFWM